MIPTLPKPRHRWPRLLACTLAASLTACGGGGGSSTPTTASPASTLSGTAVDGYLKGATVFLDVNGNGLADAGEPSALTDDNGHYVLDISTLGQALAGLRIVALGGIDTDTGFAFAGRLSAPADGATSGQLVSPLTSLVDALVAQGQSVADARANVAKALGLTVADLTTDPVASVANQPALYAHQVALQRAVQLIAGADRHDGESAHDAQTRIYRAIAQVIATQNTPATVGELLSRLSASESAAGKALADAIESAVSTALQSSGGLDSAKATLRTMDEIRVEMANTEVYDLKQIASRLDERSKSKVYSKLSDSSDKASQTEAITVVSQTKTTTLTQPTNTQGRLLASNCFQCHGTGGVGGFERIRGGDAGEVKEFLTKPARGSIMAAHAQGYTSAQLDLIIAYLKQ